MAMRRPGPRLPMPAATQEERGLAPVPDVLIEAGGKRLGELLVQSRVISHSQLTEALLQQTPAGPRIGRLLVDLGALDERDLATVLADQSGLEIADLRRDRPEPEAVLALPEVVARTIGAVPLRRVGSLLEVAVADPSDHVRGLLSDQTGLDVRLLVAPASEVLRVIDNTYRAVSAIEGHIQAFAATGALRKAAAPLQQAAATDDAPVVQIVNLIITQGLRDRASDIHVEPQDRRVRIRFRIDGALHDVLAVPSEMGPAVVSRIKIQAGMNIVERRRPQDGQFATEVDGRALDVRVSSAPTIWGEKVVMRLLDKSRPLFRAADLGMPDDTHDSFSKLVRSPFGMVVCVGPTGSGKTTTLYATLGEINSTERNIMTIEDPVEYILPSINQIQINEQSGVTFADGLKSILRQDPDIILVGEIRDPETARIAVQSALTGHLVLSSLHATDTAAALHRFLDMGIEAFLVASSVVGVVGQRLVRRICPTCKSPYRPTTEERAFYEQSGGSHKTKFWSGEGCNFCAGTGYQDRIGVYELLRITPEIKRLIVGWATQEEIRRLAITQGMRTLLEEALSLVNRDVTTISEVIRGIYAT